MLWWCVNRRRFSRFRGNIQRIVINVSRPARFLSDPFKGNRVYYTYTGKLLKYLSRSTNIISLCVCVCNKYAER